MTIEFNTMMLPVKNLSDINESTVQMYILPNNDWPSKYVDFNMSRLNFTWEVTKFAPEGKDKSIMLVSLDFNSPGSISPDTVQDKI